MADENNLSKEYSTRSWPSVEEQIARSKAPPGSALEQLIRENQDFDMLNPEEAQDDLEIPLWLRVYWRKLHPGGRHAPGDPSGGYPLAMDKILHSMLNNPDNPTGPADSAKKPATPSATDVGTQHGGEHGK
jgi:hypothetical protein